MLPARVLMVKMWPLVQDRLKTTGLHKVHTEYSSSVTPHCITGQDPEFALYPHNLSILMFRCHLRLGLPSGPLSKLFPTKIKNISCFSNSSCIPSLIFLISLLYAGWLSGLQTENAHVVRKHFMKSNKIALQIVWNYCHTRVRPMHGSEIWTVSTRHTERV
jgi:hypothetical protein